jgi:4-diphosphocytidyl-2-C-methyl-D-erythritol kinase
MSQNQLKMKAPAKINYVLEIGAKRKDGFHEINTVFQTISLYDELTFSESARDIEVQTDSDSLRETEKNLVFKAAALLRRVKNVNRGAKIELKKNIPIGSGLGGGSSDAACTLRGLNKIWNLNLNETDMISYASQLGADVPFFLKGGVATGKGKGEKLSNVGAGMKPRLPIVVICPPFGISTAEVYKIWDQENYTSRGKGLDEFMRALYKKDMRSIATALYNDFEDLVIKKHPIIAEVKLALMKTGALGSLMSGSGSAVYGIFPDERSADNAVEILGSQGNALKAFTV